MRSLTKKLNLAGLAAIAAGLAIVATRACEIDAPSGATSASPAHAVPANPAPIDITRVALEQGDTRPELGTGTYSAPIGTELRFTMCARFVTSFGLGAAKLAGRLDHQLKGEMHLAVLARRGRELLVAMRCPGVAAELQGERGERDVAAGRALALDLARTVIVRMRDDGSTLGLRFAAETSVDARSYVRALCAAFRFVVPHGAGQSWQTIELDTTGSCTVVYERRADPVRIAVEKRRVRYAPEAVATRPQMRVIGASVGAIDPRVGWLVLAECNERVDASVAEAELSIEQGCEARLELVSAGLGAERAEADAWNGSFDDARGQADAREAARARELARLEQSLRDVRLDELLLAIDTRLRAGEAIGEELYETRTKLALLLRLRAGEVTRAVARVADGSLCEQARSLVLGALGSAGTEAAQDALATIVARHDVRISEHDTLAAMQSMFQLGAPARACGASVKALADLPEASSAQRGTALLLLGAFVARHAGSARAGALCDELLAREQAAQRTGQLDTWIEALGNAGTDAALLAVARHRDSGTPEIAAKAREVLARRGR